MRSRPIDGGDRSDCVSIDSPRRARRGRSDGHRPVASDVCNAPFEANRRRVRRSSHAHRLPVPVAAAHAEAPFRIAWSCRNAVVRACRSVRQRRRGTPIRARRWRVVTASRSRELPARDRHFRDDRRKPSLSWDHPQQLPHQPVHVKATSSGPTSSFRVVSSLDALAAATRRFARTRSCLDIALQDTNMGQRSPVAPDRGSHTTENKGISHRGVPPVFPRGALGRRRVTRPGRSRRSRRPAGGRPRR